MLQNILTILLLCACIGYLGLMGYAMTMADSMIFPKIEPSYQDGPEILKLQASDGERIAAYHLKAAKSKTLLLYCHGNGEDLGHFRLFLENFQQAGISVLAYDYPGYGTSTGTSSEAGCYAASDAAYKYAIETLGYAPEQITLYGRSLGGGPACWLAQRYSVGRMILDGTFTSTFRVMTHRRLLPWDKFNNLARLPDIQCPILFVHGTDDLTVPFHHATTNYDSYTGIKETLWIEGAGHSDLYEIAGPRFWDTVLHFIQRSHVNKTS